MRWIENIKIKISKLTILNPECNKWKKKLNQSMSNTHLLKHMKKKKRTLSNWFLKQKLNNYGQ